MDRNGTETMAAQAFETEPAGLHWVPLLLSLALAALCTWRLLPFSKGASAPLAGFRSTLEPGLVTRLRFALGSPAIIKDGYSKWKDSMFRISRIDGDLLVVSRKYLDELQNTPHDKVSSISGLIRNFGGKYSGISLLKESTLGVRALQAKITPNLPAMADAMREDLDYRLQKEFPACEDWTLVSVQPILLKLIIQLTQRVFIGLPLCRDEDWQDLISQYSHNLTLNQIAMRTVPPIFRPVLDAILPTARKYKAARSRGKQIVLDEMERRRQDPDEEPRLDMLQAMMDLAKPGDKESEPDDLAHRQLLMTTVAGHSTAAAGSHALFDLASMPEFADELRNEISQVLKDEGGHWRKQSLSKLWKMDSFLRESQRVNPPSLLGFQRVIEDPKGWTLKDGSHIPYGTHLCMTPHAVSSDPDVVSDPASFDPLRYYRKRQQDPEDASRYQHATVDKDHFHFGYGTWSCPGRFLASAELKLILVELLLRYDIKIPGGGGRPRNRHISEFPFLNPDMQLLMKRRD